VAKISHKVAIVTRRSAFRAAPEPYRRARKLKPRDVVCPDCHAAIGDHCITASGSKKSGGVHVARNRIAARLANQIADELGFDRLQPVRMYKQCGYMHVVITDEDDVRTTPCGMKLRSRTPTTNGIAADISCETCKQSLIT